MAETALPREDLTKALMGFEVQPSGLYLPRWLEMVGGSAKVFASAADSDSVVPADATVLEFNALYIGTGGTIAIKHSETGAVKTFTNVQDGTILPVAGVRVMSTGTTAANIMALRW